MNYLVIGLYEDDFTRFAEEVEADSPQEAEATLKIDYPGLIVAGVLTSPNLKEVRVVA